MIDFSDSEIRDDDLPPTQPLDVEAVIRALHDAEDGELRSSYP